MEQPATPRDTWRRWEAEQAAIVIDSINRVREARGVSLRRMAELLDEVGWPIGFGTLAGILSSKKRAGFTIAEVFAFARALDVAPGYLMFGLPAGQVPALPVLPRPLSSGEMLLWLTGEIELDRLFGPDPTDMEDRVSLSTINALRDAAGLESLLHRARQENAILIAAQTFKSGELDGYFSVDLLRGEVLRFTLAEIQDQLDTIEGGTDELRPAVPAIPAPFDVVLDRDLDLRTLELPLPVVDERDVTDATAYLAGIVKMFRPTGPKRRPPARTAPLEPRA